MLASVAPLSLALAGCADCRLPIGLEGAPGLGTTLAGHRRTCLKRHPALRRSADEVCPGCGCEAELYHRSSGSRCSDCLAELLLDEFAIPAAVGTADADSPALERRRSAAQGLITRWSVMVGIAGQVEARLK